jgi:hypothetical protein
MKRFRDKAEIDQMDRVIETLKEVERLLQSVVTRGEEFTRPVPVNAPTTNRIIAESNRIALLRMEMQEEAFQHRKNLRLPLPPDGYC